MPIIAIIVSASAGFITTALLHYLRKIPYLQDKSAVSRHDNIIAKLDINISWKGNIDDSISSAGRKIVGTIEERSHRKQEGRTT